MDGIACLLNSNTPDDLSNNEEFQELLNDYFFASEEQTDNSESVNFETDLGEEDSLSDVTDSGASLTKPSDVNTRPVVDIGDEEDGVEECGIFSDDQGDIMEAIKLDFVSEDEVVERAKIEKFSCSCSYSGGKPCSTQFGTEDFNRRRMAMSELADRDVKDMLLLGVIQSHITLTEDTCRKKQKKTARVRPRTSYYIEGKRICRTTFRFMFAVGQDHLSKLIKHYQQNGLSPQTRKYPGRKNNRHALSFETAQRVVSYVTNYAEEHAFVLPGRVPGYHRSNIALLLPSSDTKTSVWRKYVAAMEVEGQRPVQASTFRKLWLSLLPHVVVARPMTDLCWTCQSNNSLILRSVNTTEEEKSAKLVAQEAHLVRATAQRSHLKECVAASKRAIGDRKLGPNPPLSADISMHYSFDFAQQIHYPADPQQAGPIYFLTPRKCGLFGVCCEAIPQQVNYLLDECVTIKKGSDCIVSFLHHFFTTYGLGETRVDLHCDNCSGQNKNRFMLWYLAWRTMTGRHQTVTLNFLLTGHTKFSPDWCFGLIKKCYRRTMVSSLAEVAQVVSDSSVKGINIPQLVGTEDGDILVEQFDWQAFLSPYFIPLKNIKQYHHFRFDAASPGIVFYREFADSPEQSFQLSRAEPPMDPPRPVTPPGMSVARQKYLFDKIRPFCKPGVRDLVCPAPQPELQGQ